MPIHNSPLTPHPSPQATIAICTYNRADLLRQTLEGLVAQRFTGGHEIIVIDNNSRDNTREVVASFAAANPAPRYIHEAKQGLAHARNRAIGEARGAILAFGDDDILMEPDWLELLTTPFRGACGDRIAVVGGEVIPVFPHGLPDWVAEWHAPLAFRRDAGPLGARENPMGANLAFRREVFAQVGAFATGIGRTGANLLAGEETEMLRRIRAAGFEIWFAPAAAVRHQLPASRTTFRYASRHAFDSARSRVIERAAQPGAAGYLLGRFAGNVLKASGFALLAALNGIVFRRGPAKKALVRAWRSCGYLYQIPRSMVGKT